MSKLRSDISILLLKRDMLNSVIPIPSNAKTKPITSQEKAYGYTINCKDYLKINRTHISFSTNK